MAEQAALRIDRSNDVATRRAKQSDLTPPGLAVDLAIALDNLLAETPRCALDPCAGGGIWGQVERVLWPTTTLVGCDVRSFESRAATHYDRFFAGIPIEELLEDRGDLRGLDAQAEDLAAFDNEEVDAAVTNPNFRITFERHEGKGRASRQRPCLLDRFFKNLPRLRLIALLGPSQVGQRGDSPEIFGDLPPILQLRATAPAACRGGSTTDQRDYSLFVWGEPELFTVDLAPRFPGAWTTANVPAVSTCGACYRWENGRPGDAELTPVLVERLRAAAKASAERRAS